MKLPRRVNGWVDRHGRPRYYLRIPGQKMVALPGLPWSPVFMSAYEAAWAGQPVPMTALPIGSSRTKSGSINEAVVRFYEHGTFTGLGKLHQTRHRQVLNKFRQASPHQVAAITGHKDLREIQVYAEAYNRELAGDQAMAALDEQVAQ